MPQRSEARHGGVPARRRRQAAGSRFPCGKRPQRLPGLSLRSGHREDHPRIRSALIARPRRNPSSRTPNTFFCSDRSLPGFSSQNCSAGALDGQRLPLLVASAHWNGGNAASAGGKCHSPRRPTSPHPELTADVAPMHDWLPAMALRRSPNQFMSCSAFQLSALVFGVEQTELLCLRLAEDTPRCRQPAGVRLAASESVFAQLAGSKCRSSRRLPKSSACGRAS